MTNAITKEKKVTVEEFRILADNFWNKTLKAYDTMSRSEADAFKASEYSKLMEYEIVIPESELPLPNTNPEIMKIIKDYCTSGRRKNDHCMIYEGKAGSAYDSRPLDDCYRPNIRLPAGFKYISEWSSSYRECFVNSGDMVTLTICEGDLTIAVYNSREAYYQGIKEADEFYKVYA